VNENEDIKICGTFKSVMGRKFLELTAVTGRQEKRQVNDLSAYVKDQEN
jgi:hypothetical protein